MLARGTAKMGSNISTAISSLEHAESTEQMTIAAKQIAECKAANLTAEQLTQLTRAIAEAARFATDAESVVAWTQLIAAICAVESQATRDAFATYPIVEAFAQVAVYAASPESVQCLSRALHNITCSKTQSTKDAFATPAIVTAFSQLASRATAPESVHWLSNAMSNITNGTTQSTRDAFATPAIVASFVRLAFHATTPESVECLSRALHNIMSGTTQSTKDAFTTPAIVDVFSQLARNATTPGSVDSLSKALHTITSSTTQSTRDAFATPAIVASFVRLAFHATTPESVECLSRALHNIMSGTTQSTKDAFTTPAIVDVFSQLARNATTPGSVDSLSKALHTITSSTTQSTKDAIANPAIEAAIIAVFSQLTSNATTPESVQCLSRAMCDITSRMTQSTKDTFVTPSIGAAFSQLASHATTPACVQSLSRAMGAVARCTTQSTKEAFATPETVAIFMKLACSATTAESVRSLSSAISNFTSGMTQATKDAFASRALIDVFSQLACNATTPESVQCLSRAVCDITSGTTKSTKDSFAPAIADAFSQMASFATTPESVEWLSRALCQITSGRTQSTNAAFATPPIGAAFSQLASQAATEESVECLSRALCNITSATTQLTKHVFTTPAVISAFVHLARSATTAESVECLSEAWCNITAIATLSTKEALANPAILPALVELAANAATAQSVECLSRALCQITNGTFATPAILAFFSELTSRATTPGSVQWLSRAVCNIASYTTQSAKATVVSAIVAAFVQLAPHATTAESVQWLSWAMSNIANGAMIETKYAFPTPPIVAAFSQLASHATTADSVHWLSWALCSITDGATQSAKEIFAAPRTVAFFSELAGIATTGESVEWLSNAMSNITSGTTQSAKDAFATPAIVASFVQLASHANSPVSVECLSRALYNIMSSTTQSTKDAFATVAITHAFSQLALHATTPESDECLSRALRDITSDTAQLRKEALASPSVVLALAQREEVAFHSMKFCKRIATGSCGAVLAGTLHGTNEAVAIKELAGREAMDAIGERGKHMMLHHRNIVRMLGVSQDGRGHAYTITELAPGGSLADALKSHPRRDDWATLVRWALDIAHGLQYLHSLAEPVLHLDLKPQNVLLFDDGTAKLCDFGTTSCQTVVQFSPHYAAPEQFAFEAISAATDVYGFGGVLFTMITKSDPWAGLTMFQICGKLKAGTPPSLPSPPPAECPDTLAAIVQRCLQIDPKQRCPLSQVIEDLIRVRDELASPRSPRDVTSSSSLLEILKLFESCPTPTGRSDIPVTYRKPTSEAIRGEYTRVSSYIPRSHFASDMDHEDAMAVGLYTDESFVYYLVNAWANDTSADQARGLRHVGPFMRRLNEALPRCCDRYSGPAVRVLRAGARAPQAMRDAFADAERQFATGAVLYFRGFASFIRGGTAGMLPRDASIVLWCRNVEAFDVDPYSIVRLAGGRSKGEVLCLAPFAFHVSQPPIKTESSVDLYTDMQGIPLQPAGMPQFIEDLIRVRDELLPRTMIQEYTGWLSDVASSSSLLEILKLFESCPTPPERRDIPGQFRNPTLRDIHGQYECVASYIPRSDFFTVRDHEDAMAVGLYTAESFVYWLVNAWANDTSPDQARGLRHVGPFMRRLIEALPRCCDRYSGPAVRVLRAGPQTSRAMQDAFADAERHFAKGRVLQFQSFLSFSHGSTADERFMQPDASIVLFCSNIEAFDVDRYSMVRLCKGGHSEGEVLCMPPSAFRVTQPTTKTESTVTVYIDMQTPPVSVILSRDWRLSKADVIAQDSGLLPLGETLLAAVKQDGLALEYVSREIASNPDIVLVAVEQNGLALEYASKEIASNPDIVLVAVKQNGLALEYASKEIASNPDIVLVAVKQNGLVLEYAPKEIASNSDIVLAAVKQNGLALQYASDELRDDAEIVLAADKQNGLALQYASSSLRDDRDIVLAAVKQNGLALQYASSSLRDNHDIVLAAVKQNGLALGNTSSELRADREVVLAAVGFCAGALRFVAGSLRSDREVVLLAVLQDNTALQYAHESLLADEYFMLEVSERAATARYTAAHTLYPSWDLPAVIELINERFAASGKLVSPPDFCTTMMLSPLVGYRISSTELVSNATSAAVTPAFTRMWGSRPRHTDNTLSSEQLAVRRAFDGLFREGCGLVVYYGCSSNVARNIAEHGFTGRLQRDDGCFGRGIYVTPNAEYACQNATPDGQGAVVVVCRACVPFAYFVTRADYDGSNAAGHSKLYGQALKSEEAHFALVSRSTNYEACEREKAEYCELCVSQAAALCPIAILHIEATEGTIPWSIGNANEQEVHKMHKATQPAPDLCESENEAYFRFGWSSKN